VVKNIHSREWWRVLPLGHLVAVLALFVAAGCLIGLAFAVDASALAPGMGAPTPVYRWWNDSDKDFISVPAHGTQQSDATLTSYGYVKTPSPQYYVSMIGASDPDMVAVYRWWNNNDKDWVDIRNGSPSDATMTSWGYTNKTFQYYAYSTMATGRVAVNRWWNASDKDWITLRQDEIADATLVSWGYTSKILVAYANALQSPTGELGYFPLGTPQSAVVPTSMVAGYKPHTMSILDVNPSLNPLVNNGYRYLGYFGHNECSSPQVQGIYIARTNDLDASTWQEDSTPPSFVGTPPCRWASALIDGSSIDLVVNQIWDGTITGQVSSDGLNGTSFSSPITFVSEPGVANGNPTLFRDPTTNTFYLYWYRQAGGEYEIRVKSSSTFSGLLGSGPTDIGQLVAHSPEIVAAPQVMYVNGKYYLAVETFEGCMPSSNCRWKTRILTSTSPVGSFYEIPGNPVYGAGAACVFQHVVGNTLHSYYCQLNTPNDPSTWTLNHVTADLTNPN